MNSVKDQTKEANSPRRGHLALLFPTEPLISNHLPSTFQSSGRIKISLHVNISQTQQAGGSTPNSILLSNLSLFLEGKFKLETTSDGTM